MSIKEDVCNRRGGRRCMGVQGRRHEVVTCVGHGGMVQLASE